MVPVNDTSKTFLFTSESVGDGHPDKICDQISDAILDACLLQDPFSKVAVDTALGKGLVVVLGVVTTLALFDVDEIVRETLRDIGYDQPGMDIEYKTCEVMNKLEILRPCSVDALFSSMDTDKHVAGDQGIMVGYATSETTSMLPLTLELAKQITRAMRSARRSGLLPSLRPDTKAQVTVKYRSDGGQIRPLYVTHVVVTLQHDRSLSLQDVRTGIRRCILDSVLPPNLVNDETQYLIQPCGNAGISPSGKFVGLTGRKIVVDTYGGWASHGGGCLSGKDSRQVDRTGAYLARWIAKSIVSSRLASRCCVHLSFYNGATHPMSMLIDTYGTSAMSTAELEVIVKRHFTLQLGAVVLELGLLEPKYLSTARDGHFADPLLPWEQPKMLKAF